MRSHSSCLFDTGQSLLVDFELCASTRLVFFDTGQPLSVDFGICAPTRLVFFTLISLWSVAVGGLWLVRFHSSFVFDAGQPLSADFDLCVSTRLVFWTLVSRCRWTLTCALPLVLSFSHWSAAVGGLWLVRSHSSCLFHSGQSLSVDFDLCASTRLVFFTLVSRCWWTMACALPLLLSFSLWSVAVGGLWLVRFSVGGLWLLRTHSSCLFDAGQSLLVDFDLCAPTRLVFFTLVSR